LRGSKATLYEGGIRSPLIVWGPALLSGDAIGASNNVTVIAGFDLPVSLLAIAGIDADIAPGIAEADFDGLDMSAALLGRDQPTRQLPIMFVRPPDRPGRNNSLPDLGIRSGPWKLLINRDGSRPELFHIPTDPTESINLAADHDQLVTDLARRLIEWDRTLK
jgi:arylsulfatase A-like enzyme